jgi:hypothetical protein
MAPQADTELSVAWRAMPRDIGKEGWQLISLERAGTSVVFAAMKYPARIEALVVQFESGLLPDASSLPTGRGFEVKPFQQASTSKGGPCVVLCRHEGAALELFRMMADDCLAHLKTVHRFGSRQVDQFLARVSAWQDFMERGKPDFLSKQNEIGLFGELVVLQELMTAGVPAGIAVECWQGPFRAIHDYCFDGGAIEVKTATTSTGFLAKVGSIEQLDETIATPLFLAAVRIKELSDGVSLPTIVESFRNALGESSSRTLFEGRLRVVGYVDEHVEHYTSRYKPDPVEYHEVTGNFPRLVARNVHSAIRRLTYEFDVELAGSTPDHIHTVKQRLGL